MVNAKICFDDCFCLQNLQKVIKHMIGSFTSENCPIRVNHVIWSSKHKNVHKTRSKFHVVSNVDHQIDWSPDVLILSELDFRMKLHARISFSISTNQD